MWFAKKAFTAKGVVATNMIVGISERTRMRMLQSWDNLSRLDLLRSHPNHQNEDEGQVVDVVIEVRTDATDGA